MRNLFFTLFAISLAAVAAMTATTAMLNAPVRKAPDVMISSMTQADPAPPDQSGGAPAGETAPAPDKPPAAGAKSEGGAATDTKAATTGEEEVDKDPYEGIAPEELPPDLQYSADSSVSFPTNI